MYKEFCLCVISFGRWRLEKGMFFLEKFEKEEIFKKKDSFDIRKEIKNYGWRKLGKVGYRFIDR